MLPIISSKPPGPRTMVLGPRSTNSWGHDRGKSSRNGPVFPYIIYRMKRGVHRVHPLRFHREPQKWSKNNHGWSSSNQICHASNRFLPLPTRPAQRWQPHQPHPPLALVMPRLAPGTVSCSAGREKCGILECLSKPSFSWWAWDLHILITYSGMMWDASQQKLNEKRQSFKICEVFWQRQWPKFGWNCPSMEKVSTRNSMKTRIKFHCLYLLVSAYYFYHSHPKVHASAMLECHPTDRWDCRANSNCTCATMAT